VEIFEAIYREILMKISRLIQDKKCFGISGCIIGTAGIEEGIGNSGKR